MLLTNDTCLTTFILTTLAFSGISQAAWLPFLSVGRTGSSPQFEVIPHAGLKQFRNHGHCPTIGELYKSSEKSKSGPRRVVFRSQGLPEKLAKRYADENQMEYIDNMFSDWEEHYPDLQDICQPEFNVLVLLYKAMARLVPSGQITLAVAKRDHDNSLQLQAILEEVKTQKGQVKLEKVVVDEKGTKVDTVDVWPLPLDQMHHYPSNKTPSLHDSILFWGPNVDSNTVTRYATTNKMHCAQDMDPKHVDDVPSTERISAVLHQGIEPMKTRNVEITVLLKTIDNPQFLDNLLGAVKKSRKVTVVHKVVVYTRGRGYAFGPSEEIWRPSSTSVRT